MKQMLERTVWALTNQLKAGDFVPEAYELRFFGGKIDRVDVCDSEVLVYVKVMDYMTGSKAFDIVALYHGLQLQLMIYMDAAIEFQKKRHPEKEVVPAGVFYYRIQDPIVDKTKDKEEAEQADEALRVRRLVAGKVFTVGILKKREVPLFHQFFSFSASHSAASGVTTAGWYVV